MFHFSLGMKNEHLKKGHNIGPLKSQLIFLFFAQKVNKREQMYLEHPEISCLCLQGNT